MHRENDHYFIFNFEAIHISKCWQSRRFYTAFYDDLHEAFNVPFGDPMRTFRNALQTTLCYLQQQLPNARALQQQLRGQPFVKQDDHGRLYLYGIAELEASGDHFVFGENDGCRRIYDQIERYMGGEPTGLETLARQLKRFYPRFAKEDWLLMARLERDLKRGRVKHVYNAANPTARRRAGWHKTVTSAPVPL